MRLLQPLTLLVIGLSFIIFLIAVNDPVYPVPNLLGTAHVDFPSFKDAWGDRLVGFSLFNQGRNVHIGWLGHTDEDGVDVGGCLGRPCCSLENRNGKLTGLVDSHFAALQRSNTDRDTKDRSHASRH